MEVVHLVEHVAFDHPWQDLEGVESLRMERTGSMATSRFREF